MESKDTWWKYGVIYQIYVRSFYDSNGDGVGDLHGILHKIDYIQSLGVDAIWLSPIHKSPMKDYGYDVSDYWDIHEDYGTLNDFEALIREAHKRDIRVIMDIAINHTSAEHPWFLESRNSRQSPKRDWYIWKKGFGKLPPNNWMNGAFESAWKYDKKSGEYYLHSFLDFQPDLNWRNAEVQKNFLAILEYWYNFGVDGFRLDMVNWLIKDKKARNNPSLFNIRILQKHVYNKNQKAISAILKKLRRMTDRFFDKVLIGEVFTLPPGNPELSAAYVGENLLHMAFDFSLLYRVWNSRSYYKSIARWENLLKNSGWPCYVFSNHDQVRSFSRLKGRHADSKARAMFVLLFTLRGTPFLYYGEEIGMKNYRLPKKKIKDPLGKKFWPFYSGRDGARLPMQWNARPNGGFSSFEPWLPLHPEFRKNNAAKQTKDKNSLLNHVKTLIHLRKKHKALNRGEWICELSGKKGVLAYHRRYGAEHFFIALNFTGREKKIRLPNGVWTLRYSTLHGRNARVEQEFVLQPYEAVIFETTRPDSK